MKKFVLFIAILCAAIPAVANYVVHSVSGDVRVTHNGTTTKVKKGMAVNAPDELTISQGASVEILNASTKKIYRSVKSGKTTVSRLMIEAQGKATDNSAAVNSNIAVAKGKSDKSGRVYVEKGAVTREIEVVDSIGNRCLRIDSVAPCCPPDSVAQKCCRQDGQKCPALKEQKCAKLKEQKCAKQKEQKCAKQKQDN